MNVRELADCLQALENKKAEVYIVTIDGTKEIDVAIDVSTYENAILFY